MVWCFTALADEPADITISGAEREAIVDLLKKQNTEIERLQKALQSLKEKTGCA